MESFNQTERPPIAPEDNLQAKIEREMKLIAEYGIAAKFQKRKGFWRRISSCCCGDSEESDDEVVHMSVPVKHLNRRLHVLVHCKRTKINLKMHPEANEDGEITRLRQMLSTLEADERGTLSTRFSSPFSDVISNAEYCDAESTVNTIANRRRRGNGVRCKTL